MTIMIGGCGIVDDDCWLYCIYGFRRLLCLVEKNSGTWRSAEHWMLTLLSSILDPEETRAVGITSTVSNVLLFKVQTTDCPVDCGLNLVVWMAQG